jgi:hypothetical protein
MQWLVLIVALFWLAPLTLVLIGGVGCAISHVFRTKLMWEFFGDSTEPMPSKQLVSGG